MTGTALAEMGEDEVLAAAESCADTIRDAEAELLRLAYQWAVMHSPDRLDPATASQPGRERARLYGGAGTPEVCEFAAAQLGVADRPVALRRGVADGRLARPAPPAPPALGPGRGR